MTRNILKLRIAKALRKKLNKGYSLSDLRSDIMAGMVVAMVAIPLGMALAIASGVPPQYGLYTVVIGGGVVALLGGSKFQVTGPTAAFVVVLAPIAHKFGLGGLLVAGLMAGVIILIMGLAKMGKLIQFIPYPVTTGFTSGIAVVIATLQLKDFFGLQIVEMPERFIEKVLTIFRAYSTASVLEFSVGVSTLLFLIFWPKLTKKIPAPLVALTVVSAVVALVKMKFPAVEIATIGSRFTYELNGVIGHGIPKAAPHLGLPWLFSTADGKPFVLSLETLQLLFPSALAITMLGAIESLLSAVVADGMTQTKHDPDSELIALGIGNILCPFFGGIAATGAIARTATNIRFGAKSPIAAVVHAVFTLIVILSLAPLVSYLPMASLAALLMLVAYNMSEMKHFMHILRVGPKSDITVLVLCFFLTVAFDMVMGVSVGIGIASFLFMKRMADVSSARMFTEEYHHPHLTKPIPKDVILYEIAGPLFFGAAENAVEAISSIQSNIRAVIFNLESVPAMDVTGLVALESAIYKVLDKDQQVFLVGVNPQPLKLLSKSALMNVNQNFEICSTIHVALNQLNQQNLAV
ncbi:MAG: C4-dicarboxylic acid transporter DauA [Oligoflexia bacterium]|nr:C4-dicarboxylic acid transporter DauA [Oligoflexia bacterium]